MYCPWLDILSFARGAFLHAAGGGLHCGHVILSGACQVIEV